jgi:hypothetical protein
MKKSLIAKSLFAGLFLLAACSPAEAPQAAAAPDAAGPQGLMEQAMAMTAEQRPVFAWQQLSQRTDLQPPCTSVRSAETRGTVPADVPPDSIYAPYAGALAFAVQCGPQLTTVQSDPREHWLVVLQPGASDAAILPCVDASGFDRCIGPMPRASAP